MAFVNKRPNRESKPQNIDESQNNGIEVGNVGVDTQNTVKAPQYNTGEIKTFREQAIQVLNILEAKGIDIYDENRTPGMYLRTSISDRKSKLVKALLSKNSDVSHQQNHNQTESNPLLQKILAFKQE